MVKALIIENEISAAESLSSYLQELYPEIEILEVCKTVDASLRAIKAYSPNLVFLDIELDNQQNGFEILKRLDNIKFEVIITTSFDKYAIQACNASAIYFLLKPIAKDELAMAVEKFMMKSEHSTETKRLEILTSVYENSLLALNRITLPFIGGFEIVETADIVYCKGLNNYSKVYLSDGKEKVVSQTLKHLSDLLSHSNFFRIHKSYLVNLKCVKKYFRDGKDGLAQLNTNQELPVSREFKVEFQKLLGRR